jgi:hypothetical protein
MYVLVHTQDISSIKGKQDQYRRGTVALCFMHLRLPNTDPTHSFTVVALLFQTGGLTELFELHTHTHTHTHTQRNATDNTTHHTTHNITQHTHQTR